MNPLHAVSGAGAVASTAHAALASLTLVRLHSRAWHDIELPYST